MKKPARGGLGLGLLFFATETHGGVRGVDQQFQLYVDPDTDPNELLRQMIEGVTVRVSDISSSWARLHIQAPPAVHIIRPDSHSKLGWR